MPTVVPVTSAEPHDHPKFVLTAYTVWDKDNLYWREGEGWVSEISQATVLDTNTALAMPGWLAEDPDQVVRNLWNNRRGRAYMQPRPVAVYNLPAGMTK